MRRGFLAALAVAGALAGCRAEPVSEHSLLTAGTA